MRLPALLDKLQSQKDELLLDLDSWPSESIGQAPSTAEWSAIEVLDHLVRTEVEILAIARKGLLKPRQIGVINALRTRVLQAILRSHRKVKVPAKATAVLPGSHLELPAIVQRWNDSRRELSDMLKLVAAEKLSQGIFRHPVAGWMGMPEILEFFSAHIVHHNYQLARLRNAIQNPASVKQSLPA